MSMANQTAVQSSGRVTRVGRPVGEELAHLVAERPARLPGALAVPLNCGARRSNWRCRFARRVAVRAQGPAESLGRGWRASLTARVPSTAGTIPCT
jgi:hypothetical protein